MAKDNIEELPPLQQQNMQTEAYIVPIAIYDKALRTIRKFTPIDDGIEIVQVMEQLRPQQVKQIEEK